MKNRRGLRNLAALVVFLLLSISITVADQTTGLKGGEGGGFEIIAGAVDVQGDRGNSSNFNVTIFMSGSPTGRGNSSGFNVSLGYLYTIDNVKNVPSINLTHPLNEAFIPVSHVILNATITDDDTSVVDIYIWGSNVTDPIDFGNHSLLYYTRTTATAGTAVFYNWTAPVIDPKYYGNGLQLLYHLDNKSEFGETTEGLSNLTYDYSKNGNDGNIYSAQFTTNSSKIGGAFEFDGINDYITVSSLNPGLESGFITIAAWVNWKGSSGDTGSSGRLTLIQAQNPADDLWFNLNTSGEGRFNVYFGDLASPGYHNSNTVLSQNKWYHLAVTWDGSNVRLYVNGNEDASASTSGNVVLDTSSFKIGSREDLSAADDYFFNGTLDEIGIWNRSLSSTEIKDLARLKSGTWYWKVNVTEVETGFSATSTVNEFIVNEQKPRINASINLTQPRFNYSINISANVSDNFQLNFCQFIHNESGNNVFINQSLTGTSSTCGQNFTIGVGRGNVINYTLIVFDTANNSNRTQFIIEVNNTRPPKVNLSFPPSSNVTTNRSLLLGWINITDVDGDPINFNVHIRCVGCSSDNKDFNVTNTNTTPPSDLRFLGDDGFYYNWTVRASDGYDYGDFSDISNFTINSLVSLRMVVSSVDFGTPELGDINTTHVGDPSPFIIENNGNVNINVSVYSDDDLFDTETNPTNAFQYKIENVTGEIPAFDYFHANTSLNWTNFTGDPHLSVVNLSYQDGNDSAEVDLKIEVPLSEGVGVKSARVAFQATY